jgi:hypothetical protein
MKYNIKDYLILILFILIIYLLFFQKEHFAPDNTDELYKAEITKQCNDITQNINYILKATYDAVSNNDNFRFVNEDITINNMTVNGIVNVQENLYLNGHISVKHKYDINNNIVTPTTELNVFPDYMIVAYNMIELNEDGKTPKTTYNLPPGWVKCDGTEYYTFFDINKKKTIAVEAGYHIQTSTYDELNIDTETILNSYYKGEVSGKARNIRRIKTPNLKGRFIYGSDPKNSIDSYVFMTYPDKVTDIIKLDPNTVSIIQTAKGGQEYVHLTVDQISHNHLTHIGLKEETASVVYGKDKGPDIPLNIPNTSQSNFFPFDFANIDPKVTTYKVITTSDFTRGDEHDIPHPNMPPYYTLIYIMKIASQVILSPPLPTV